MAFRKWIGIALIAAASQAQAAPDFALLRKADKISISLTGVPLKAELKQKVLRGEMSLTELADKLSSSPEFIEYFAQFWVTAMGMQAPLDPYELKDRGGEFFRDHFKNVYWHLASQDAEFMDVEYVSGIVTQLTDVKKTIELRIKECADAPLVYMNNSDSQIATLKRAAVDGIGLDGKPVLANTKPQWQKLADFAELMAPNCEDKGTTTNVKPYWDPDKVTLSSKYVNVPSYRVIPAVLERCGPALINCSLKDDQGHDFVMDEVAQDLSKEPAYIISHVVAEDKPFPEILTTTSTIMTGSLAYFFGGRGSSLIDLFPANTLTDLKTPIFSAGSRSDRKHYWVNRGPLHAGLLTTPGFQLLTNGRRAKANRVYEAFLCKRFSVPDGIQADPTDTNPDLTKRAYCSVCHKSLEPAADFFNRWPDTGVNNYIYDNKAGVNDTGTFYGATGSGAAAFGKIASETADFDDCSVKRAFQFLNGRMLTQAGADANLATWVSDYRSSEKNLRNVIRAMVLAPDFLTAKEGQK